MRRHLALATGLVLLATGSARGVELRSGNVDAGPVRIDTPELRASNVNLDLSATTNPQLFVRVPATGPDLPTRYLLFDELARDLDDASALRRIASPTSCTGRGVDVRSGGGASFGRRDFVWYDEDGNPLPSPEPDLVDPLECLGDPAEWAEDAWALLRYLATFSCPYESRLRSVLDDIYGYEDRFDGSQVPMWSYSRGPRCDSNDQIFAELDSGLPVGLATCTSQEASAPPGPFANTRVSYVSQPLPGTLGPGAYQLRELEGILRQLDPDYLDGCFDLRRPDAPGQCSFAAPHLCHGVRDGLAQYGLETLDALEVKRARIRELRHGAGIRIMGRFEAEGLDLDDEIGSLVVSLGTFVDTIPLDELRDTPRGRIWRGKSRKGLRVLRLRDDGRFVLVGRRIDPDLLDGDDLPLLLKMGQRMGATELSFR